MTSIAWLSGDRLAMGTDGGTQLVHEIAAGALESLPPTASPVGPIAEVLPSSCGPSLNQLMHVSVRADLNQEFDPEAPPSALRRVWLSCAGNDLEADEGLFAFGAGTPLPVVAGRRTVAANQQQQQQQVAPQTPTTGLFRYELGANGAVAEAGEVGTLTGVRALAATPDGTLAVAGTENGAVVTIDMTQQISGVNPEVYMRTQQDIPTVPIVAVAAGGSMAPGSNGEGITLAAANSEGRVYVFRTTPPDDAAPLGPMHLFAHAEAGLWGENWTEWIDDSSRYDLIAISEDGSRILASMAIDKSTNYFLLDVAEDGSISGRTALNVPPGISDRTLATPGVAEAIFMGGEVQDAFRRVMIGLSNGADQSGGSAMWGARVGRRGNAAVYFLANGSGTLVTASGGEPVTLRSNFSGTQAAALSDDGRLLAATGPQGRITIYDLDNRDATPVEATVSGSPAGLAFSSDGRRLIIANNDATIDLYAVRDLRLIRRGNARESVFFNLVGDGDWIVRKISDESIEVIDTATGAAALRANLGRDIDQMLVSSDGRTIAYRSANGELGTFRKGVTAIGEGRVSFTALNPTNPVAPPDRDGLLLSADGSRLMLRTRAGKLFVADIRAPQTWSDERGQNQTYFVFSEIGLDAPAVSAAVAPDGTFLVVGDADNALMLVDLTGDAPQTLELPEHGGIVDDLAISPDGTKVAAASIDGRLRVVDLARAQLVARLPLARLASYPETPKMVARRLDEAPGTFPDTAFLEQQGQVQSTLDSALVMGTHETLAAAQAEVEGYLLAPSAPFGPDPDAHIARIFLRDGFYRTAFVLPLALARADLDKVRKFAPETAAAYVRLLDLWCPDPARRGDYLECNRPPPSGGSGAGAP
ncbi:hypothetical protein [Mesorhizobium sp. L48C026A00]|uniref:hypothetical protein n=1 Tax=Mesorhizobium sp. L48C026A00 TaxID=1287182 RepID=UPI0018DCD4E8|nr:hypothetical protein [Mesorhizobium sp. L48C026A00]